MPLWGSSVKPLHCLRWNLKFCLVANTCFHKFFYVTYVKMDSSSSSGRKPMLCSILLMVRLAVDMEVGMEV